EQSWKTLEERAGLPRAAMERFAESYGNAKTAVIVYGTGLMQHEFAAENVRALVNLALARGMIGREKCGIMPARGRDGAQGGSDCGAETEQFPGAFPVNEENARRFTNLWRHPISPLPGLTAPEMIDAAHRGAIEFLYSAGGNCMESMTDGSYAAKAVERIPFRIHQAIVVDPSMLLGAGEAVLLLPAQTRYEQRGGGTTTSAERRVRFTPEIAGHQIGEARPEWEIPALIGRRSMSNGELLFPYADTRNIREEMARVIPMYRGIEKLAREGDQFQWGGPRLYQDGFGAMPAKRARFTALEPPDRRVPPNRFYLSARSGAARSGAADLALRRRTRNRIFMAAEDAERLELEDGSQVAVKSHSGEFHGVIELAPVKPGNLQAYWPEAHALMPRRNGAGSGQRVYNVEVWVERI
ncbi:MAG: molybdopterin oxidoreductase family protein, partial [Alphaproteobacteria bacterium]